MYKLILVLLLSTLFSLNSIFIKAEIIQPDQQIPANDSVPAAEAALAEAEAIEAAQQAAVEANFKEYPQTQQPMYSQSSMLIIYISIAILLFISLVCILHQVSSM